MLKTLSKNLFAPRPTISHENLRDRLGISNGGYMPVRSLPTIYMYQAFGISYTNDRDEIEKGFIGPDGGWHSGGCKADEWYMRNRPESFARKFPSIPNREGILSTELSKNLGSGSQDLKPVILSAANKINSSGKKGPQIMYNYYQGEFSGPKLGVMVVDDTSIEHDYMDGGKYEVQRPVRFALFAKQDLDSPMGGDLSVLSIRVNGQKIALVPENIEQALDYAEALYMQIKSGAYDPDAAYAAVYGVVPVLAAENRPDQRL